MSALEAFLLVLSTACAVGFLMLLHQRGRDRRSLEARRREDRRQLDALLLREREQAAAVERERIYHDLHDDVGAKLMTMMHSAPDPRTADLARALHQDLRDVVSRAQSPPPSLLAALADIRDETGQRLSAVGAELAWEQAADVPDHALDAAASLHLFRIVREAVSNALLHARARHLRIRVRHGGHALLLDVTDDGAGWATPPKPSRGMSGMQKRASAMHGAVHWDPGTLGGTKVVLEFPLPDLSQARDRPV